MLGSAIYRFFHRPLLLGALALVLVVMVGCGGGRSDDSDVRSQSGVTADFGDGEAIQWGQHSPLFQEHICRNDENLERLPMRDLVATLNEKFNVKRILLTRGGCYLAIGILNGQRFMGVYDPLNFSEIYRTIRP